MDGNRSSVAAVVFVMQAQFICVHPWFKIEGHFSVATTVGQAVPDFDASCTA